MKKRTHLLLIDPLEKLSVKKDSSLQFALSLKMAGEKVFLLFEKDFYFNNQENLTLKVYDFQGEFVQDSSYLSLFRLDEEQRFSLCPETIIHMRIDPPFDGRYLRYLWMLRGLKKKFHLKVLNDPEGILLFNEKMVSYESSQALETYVGSSPEGLQNFLNKLETNRGEACDLIFKPLDLYQGMGVEKVLKSLSTKEIQERFCQKVTEYQGPVVVQPFMKEVEMGEIRAIFFKGKELGSILKVPPQGAFLANIAQGATYSAVDLDKNVLKNCEEICRELESFGVHWVAFDILGGKIQEANLTCPGLLVEVSKAHGKNLANEIIKALN